MSDLTLPPAGSRRRSLGTYDARKRSKASRASLDTVVPRSRAACSARALSSGGIRKEMCGECSDWPVNDGRPARLARSSSTSATARPRLVVVAGAIAQLAPTRFGHIYGALACAVLVGPVIR